MMEVLQKNSVTWVIIHAGREINKDFDSEDAAWSWADGNIDDQVLCTPNKLSPPLIYRGTAPKLRMQ